MAPIKITVSGKCSARQRAINAIFYDVARTGAYGRTAMRAMVDGRIGHEVWIKLGQMGMAHRSICNNAGCACKTEE